MMAEFKKGKLSEEGIGKMKEIAANYHAKSAKVGFSVQLKTSKKLVFYPSKIFIMKLQNCLFLILVLIYFAPGGNAQNVGLGTNTPDSRAKLDVSSTTSGFWHLFCLQ